MTPLIITPEVEADAARIREHAERPENRRTDAATTPGDWHHFSMVVPMGFQVTYSVDAADRPGVWFKHLSVSVVATGRRTVPSAGAMRLLAELFGFTPAATFGTLPSDPDSVVHALEILHEPAA